MAYATIEDVIAYNANIDVSDVVETQRLLDRASDWVDSVISCRVNADNTEGLRRATVAIVEAYAAGTEISQIVGSSGGGFQIGSFRMDKDANAGVALPSRATMALRKVGCLNSRVGWY